MKCFKCETREHIGRVQHLLGAVISDLLWRLLVHDETKLHPPESEIFERLTPKLKESTYGSDEYKKFLNELKPAIDHHYLHNRHHPEHYKDGIMGMSLIDLIEMICDWIAAAERHKDGDVFRSIELNQERFGYSDELKQIFINTVRYMFY